MIDVSKVMPKMYVGDALEEKLAVLPQYDDSVRTKSMAERLVALQDIYGIYVPSKLRLRKARQASFQRILHQRGFRQNRLSTLRYKPHWK